VGWKAMDGKLLNHQVTLRGYPGDKSPYGTEWTMGGVLEQLTQTRVGYSIDTFGGQSGSPVYGKFAFGQQTCKPCVLGIHGYGVGVNPFLTRNSGLRVTQQVFQNLLAWR
jgi:glutamyl endopeptidase